MRYLFLLLLLLEIMKLILAGRISDAINNVQQWYPGLLDRNKNLLFLLKCRQFIEMVAGNDEVKKKCFLIFLLLTQNQQ